MYFVILLTDIKVIRILDSFLSNVVIRLCHQIKCHILPWTNCADQFNYAAQRMGIELKIDDAIVGKFQCLEKDIV